MKKSNYLSKILILHFILFSWVLFFIDYLFSLSHGFLYFIENNWPYFIELPLILYLIIKLFKEYPYPSKHTLGFLYLFLSRLHHLLTIYTFENQTTSQRFWSLIFPPTTLDSFTILLWYFAVIWLAVLLIRALTPKKH